MSAFERSGLAFATCHSLDASIVPRKASVDLVHKNQARARKPGDLLMMLALPGVQKRCVCRSPCVVTQDETVSVRDDRFTVAARSDPKRQTGLRVATD